MTPAGLHRRGAHLVVDDQSEEEMEDGEGAGPGA